MKLNFFGFSRFDSGANRLMATIKTALWIGCLGLMAMPALGTDRTWTGNASVYWSNPGNWSPSGAPQDGDILHFGNNSHTTMVNDIIALGVENLIFDDSSYQLSGNTVTILPLYSNEGLTVTTNGSDRTVVINCDLQFPNGGYISAPDLTNRYTPIGITLILGGNIVIGADLTLVSAGYLSSPIYLTGSISGTGDVFLKGYYGYFYIQGNSANTFSGTVHVAESISLDCNKPYGGTVPHDLVLDDAARLVLRDENQMSGDSAVTLTVQSTLYMGTSNQTIGSLVFTNAGFIQGETGETNVIALAVLTLNHGITVVGTPPTNGWIMPAIAGNLNLNGFEPINVGSGLELDITAAISGNGFQKLGSGLLKLYGANTFFGDAEITQGTVQPMTSQAFGQAGPNYGVEIDGGNLLVQDVSIFNEPLYVNSSNSVFMGYNQATWSGPIVLNQTLRLLAIDLTSSGAVTTLSGPISGSAGILLMPTVLFPQGTVQFAGSSGNTFTGPLTVVSPLVEFNKPSGVQAFAGPLIVGGSEGPTSEARWLNSYQNIGAVLTLYTNGYVNLNNHDENFGAVTFNGGQVDSGSGGQFAIYDTLTVNPAGSTAVINGYLELPPPNNAVLNVNSGYTSSGIDLQVNAVMIGAAPYFVKQGAGTLALTAVNTFTGTTLQEGGVLDINNSGALSTGPIVIFGGNSATLRMSGSGTLNQGLELYGDGVNGTYGAISVNPGVNFTLNGSELLDTETTYFVGAGGTLQLGGVLSGNGPLTKTGTGNLVIFGNNNNTYAGDTLIQAGTASLVKNSAVAIPGNLVIGTRSSPSNNSGTTATVTDGTSSSFGGTNITVNGGSLLDLNGNNESLVTLTLNNGGSVHTGSGLLTFSGSYNATSILVSPGQGGASIISGKIKLKNGGNFGVLGRQFSLPGTGPELDLTAVVSDNLPFGLNKTGSGEMRLSGVNNFFSPVLVAGGTLTLSNSTANPLGNSGTTTISNAVLALAGSSFIPNVNLILNCTNSPAWHSLNGSNAWTGSASSVTLAQNAVVNVEAGSSLQVAGQVSGPGALNVLGGGTLQFSGVVPNSYAGPTTISAGTLLCTRPAGTLTIPGDVVIGDDTTTSTTATLRSMHEPEINPNANIALHKSGLLDLQAALTDPNAAQQLRTLTGYGMANVGTHTTMLISNNVPFDFFGTINGVGGFEKHGTGTMTYWGSLNTTGLAYIYDGDFKLNGSILNATVQVYGTGRLRGSGAAYQLVELVSGGHLAVDSKYPGQQGGALEVGSLTIFSGTVELDMFGLSPNGGNDFVSTDDNSSIGGATLSTSFSYPPHEGDVIKLMDVRGTGTIGQFANFPEGVIKMVGAVPVLPSYHGGDGNDFTLTVTNLAVGYAGYALAEGNGNQTVEPNECNLLYVSLVNRRSTAVAITKAVLRATNATGAVVTIPAATYPTIPAGQTMANSTPFQFRTDTNLPCGGAVGFELVLDVANEGEFAVNFSPASGSDCSHPTGPCGSCAVASGQFTTNTPTTTLPILFVGAPSICSPPKAYPGTNAATGLPPTPYLTHSFTNSSTNALCLTAQLDFACPFAPTNALGVAAYIGNFDPNNPSAGYLGDIGQGGPPYPAFSFQVPAATNFTLVVMAQTTNLPCANYSLEIFGLTCPPPALALEADSVRPKLKVDWSTAYPGWTLQQKTGITGVFSNAPLTPAIVGGRYTLTNITPTASQFYRLKK